MRRPTKREHSREREKTKPHMTKLLTPHKSCIPQTPKIQPPHDNQTLSTNRREQPPSLLKQSTPTTVTRHQVKGTFKHHSTLKKIKSSRYINTTNQRRERPSRCHAPLPLKNPRRYRRTEINWSHHPRNWHLLPLTLTVSLKLQLNCWDSGLREGLRQGICQGLRQDLVMEIKQDRIT